MRVHLWAIRGDDLPPSVGRRLSELADGRHDLEATDLAKVINAVTVVESPAEVAVVSGTADGGTTEMAPADVDSASPTSVGEGESGGTTSAGQMDTAASGGPAAPEAADMTPSSDPADETAAEEPEPTWARARRGSPAHLAASIRAQTPAVYLRTEDDAFARLYDLDRDAYNAPVPGDDSQVVGIAYAKRRAAAVTPEVLSAIRARHEPGFDGNIPKQVDSDLLYFGSDHGLDTWAQLEKFKLRRGFWRGLLTDASTLDA